MNQHLRHKSRQLVKRIDFDDWRSQIDWHWLRRFCELEQRDRHWFL